MERAMGKNHFFSFFFSQFTGCISSSRREDLDSATRTLLDAPTVRRKEAEQIHCAVPVLVTAHLLGPFQTVSRDLRPSLHGHAPQPWHHAGLAPSPPHKIPRGRLQTPSTRSGSPANEF